MTITLVTIDSPTVIPSRFLALALVIACAAVALVACEPAAAPPTPPISPGSSSAPREVNIIARDWSFQPPTVDVVAGETVLLHVVNGGLTVHEAVIGDDVAQDAWEAAEAAAAVGLTPGSAKVTLFRIQTQIGSRLKSLGALL